MKYKIKKITNKRISFDFDGTLEDDFDNTINYQKEEIQNILTQLQSLGNEIFIVTKRYSDKNCHLGKFNEHMEVYHLALKLKIPDGNIIFTDRELKAETLIRLGVDYHFENSDFEILHMNTMTHNIQNILITDPYWRDIIY